MKKYIKILCFLLLGLVSVSFFGCYNGTLCYADNSVTQTNNIDVKVEKTTTKAFTFGTDSDARIAKYGELGELTQINLVVSGKTDLNSLKLTCTGIDVSGKPTNNESETVYFNDNVKIKIRLPRDYAKINRLDGKGVVDIDKPKEVEDEYLKFNLPWVILNKEKTQASFNTDENENDKYLFFEFLDSNNKVLAQYFVRVQYEVEIK